MEFEMNEMEIAEKCCATMWGNDLAAQDLGIGIGITKPGCAEARLEIRNNMVNGHKACHGGYIFVLADTAFAFACNTYNRITLAASASIEFVKPAYLGDELLATASERSRGGRTGIYDVTVTNQDADVVAIFRGRSYATRKPIFESDTEIVDKPNTM